MLHTVLYWIGMGLWTVVCFVVIFGFVPFTVTISMKLDESRIPPQNPPRTPRMAWPGWPAIGRELDKHEGYARQQLENGYERSILAGDYDGARPTGQSRAKARRRWLWWGAETRWTEYEYKVWTHRWAGGTFPEPTVEHSFRWYLAQSNSAQS